MVEAQFDDVFFDDILKYHVIQYDIAIFSSSKCSRNKYNVRHDMRRSPLTIDGLWYCLCPSFRPSYLQRPSLSFKPAKEASRRFLNSASASASTTNQQFVRNRRDNRTPEHHEAVQRSHPYARENVGKLESLPASNLENRLEELSSQRQTDIFQIVDVLRVLLKKHHISPTTRHYRAYILANIDRRYGSPRNIRGLLQEMEREGITADSATLHAALEVIAVYPDDLLRQEVLGALRARWLSLSPAGWHHLITGLVHEGQLELALDRLDQMERKGIRLEQWLHSLLIYKLCDAHEFTEVLHLMRSRPKKAQYISSKMWKYLLEAAIQNSHFDLVRYVWTNAVDLGYTTLDSSESRGVLRLASEYGDIHFSESAFRHLFTLHQNLDREDYERLVHVYAQNGDIKSALEIICRMHESKLVPSSESAQPILLLLETKMNDPGTMWKDVSELKKKGFKIPVVLANLGIDYCGILFNRDILSAVRATEIAVNIYKDLFEVCSSGANTDTFNSLFALCHQTRRPDICTFFAKEMAALDVHPDQTTLETLILICLELGNFRAASMYLADLKTRGWELSVSVTDQIHSKCLNTDNANAAILKQALEQTQRGPLDSCQAKGV